MIVSSIKLFEKFKKHLIAILIVAGIGIFTICNSIRIDNINKSLLTTLEEANKKIEESNKEIEKLQAYCKELEAATDMNRKEFIYVWESLGTVRNNFIALGKGLHLEEEDICPPSECGLGGEDNDTSDYTELPSN